MGVDAIINHIDYTAPHRVVVFAGDWRLKNQWNRIWQRVENLNASLWTQICNLNWNPR